MSDEATGRLGDGATGRHGDTATGRPGDLAQPILVAQGLKKIYIEEDGSELKVLDGVEVSIARGEAVAIIGASGAGKSTLLHLLGGLDRPTSGQVLLSGRDLAGLNERELAAVRNQAIGFVFQFHHLL